MSSLRQLQHAFDPLLLVFSGYRRAFSHHLFAPDCVHPQHLRFANATPTGPMTFRLTVLDDISVAGKT
jgi:hypothetical protein